MDPINTRKNDYEDNQKDKRHDKQHGEKMSNIKSDEDYTISSLMYEINIEYHTSFFTPDTTERIFKKLEEIEWSRRRTNNRRSYQIYGNKNYTYETTFGNITYKKNVHIWDEYVLKLKNLAELLTKEQYNYCIARRFPNGDFGLRDYGSHKFNIISNNTNEDKYVTENNTVSTFLFGAIRMIKLTAVKNLLVSDIKLMLSSGSLYITRSPTDRYWNQEILKSSTDQPTITLTFYKSINN